MIIGFVIWSLCTLVFLFIAFSCLKSETAVGFFTFVNPPVVRDVKRYNKSVAILWFVFAIVFEILGALMLFLEQNSPGVIGLVFGALLWVIGLILGYLIIASRNKTENR